MSEMYCRRIAVALFEALASADQKKVKALFDVAEEFADHQPRSYNDVQQSLFAREVLDSITHAGENAMEENDRLVRLDRGLCQYCGEPGSKESPLKTTITSPPVSGFAVELLVVHAECGAKRAADIVR